MVMSGPKSTREKWMEERDDLTGEHAFGDGGQVLFALLFFGVWIIDVYVLKYTTQLNDVVSPLIRRPVGIALLCVAAYCAWSGLKIVFGEVRETPSVIRKGVFGKIRHPIYFSEVLLYFGLLLIDISLVAAVVWLGAAAFLYYLSRHEERLLLDRFGDDYQTYIREVGMWIPRIRKKT